MRQSRTFFLYISCLCCILLQNFSGIKIQREHLIRLHFGFRVGLTGQGKDPGQMALLVIPTLGIQWAADARNGCDFIGIQIFHDACRREGIQCLLLGQRFALFLGQGTVKAVGKLEVAGAGIDHNPHLLKAVVDGVSLVPDGELNGPGEAERPASVIVFSTW